MGRNLETCFLLRWEIPPFALREKKSPPRSETGFSKMEATLRVGSFRRVSAGFFCQKFDEKYIKIHHVYYRSICFITLDIHFCREFAEVPEESCPLVKELKDLDRSCESVCLEWQIGGWWYWRGGDIGIEDGFIKIKRIKGSNLHRCLELPWEGMCWLHMFFLWMFRISFVSDPCHQKNHWKTRRDTRMKHNELW